MYVQLYILYTYSRFIESAARVFRLIVSSPTYSWQLATLVALRILKNSFQKMPSQPPTALHPLSGLRSLPQSIWRVPSNESSDIKWKRLSIPSISEYKMLLCNPKWVQMWQTSATFVRQRQASSIYRDIYNIYNVLYVSTHIQKIIQLSAESSDRSVGAVKVIHINCQINYKIQKLYTYTLRLQLDILQDSETITNRYISLKVTARFDSNFATRHSWNSILNTIRYQLATLLIGGLWALEPGTHVPIIWGTYSSAALIIELP